MWGGGGARRRLDEDLVYFPVHPEVLAGIRHALGRGKKIEAIKVLRDATRLGLKEAKDLVEMIEAGHRPPPPGWAQPAGTGTDLASRVRQLRDSGQPAEAILLVCRETGMTVPDAETFVRALS